MQMFNQAHNLSISGGSFNIIGRDLLLVEGEKYQGPLHQRCILIKYESIFSSWRSQGLSVLYQNASTSALYDSEARFPPPLCHPGTRLAILNRLTAWVSSSRLDEPSVYWLYGPAGAGKSAIAQTLAESCAANGTLAASFFFWRLDPLRNTPRHLFTTIALQLALSIPQLRPIINSLILEKPTLLTSSIENQFQQLILGPLVALELPVQPLLVIIDGLDECSDSSNQRRILSIIANGLPIPSLPLRLLIASRPEPRIREAFAAPMFHHICGHILLDDTYQASQDIGHFLYDRFRGILEHHKASMMHIPLPWPKPSHISQLVAKASGQFIFASTVVRYCDDDFTVPADRLNTVLGLTPLEESSEQPFSDLDALYRQILSSNKNTAQLVKILGTIIVMDRSKIIRHTNDPRDVQDALRDVFEHILHMPLGVVQAALSGMHSLFDDPSPIGSGFQFCHASFRDFLTSPQRSLEYYIDCAIHHDVLALGCLKMIANDCSSGSSWQRDPSPGLRYAYDTWNLHCEEARGSHELAAVLQVFDIYAFTMRLCSFISFNEYISGLHRSYCCLLPYIIRPLLALKYISTHLQRDHTHSSPNLSILIDGFRIASTTQPTKPQTEIFVSKLLLPLGYSMIFYITKLTSSSDEFINSFDSAKRFCGYMMANFDSETAIDSDVDYQDWDFDDLQSKVAEGELCFLPSNDHRGQLVNLRRLRRNKEIERIALYGS